MIKKKKSPGIASTERASPHLLYTGRTKGPHTEQMGNKQ
jgi:hypothetical protein